MSDTRTVSQTFPSYSDAPYYVKAITNGERRWTKSLGPVEFTYSYCSSLPKDSSLHSELTGIGPIDESHYSLIENAWEKWTAVAKITAKRIADPTAAMICFFQFDSAKGYPQAEGITKQLTSDGITKRALIGISSQIKHSPSKFKHNGMHEIGHALGFFHGFEKMPEQGKYTVLPASEHSVQFSLMNYIPTDVIPRGPTVYDTAAAQFNFGPNLETGAGDTVYKLWSYQQSHSTQADLYTLWDSGGSDWLDASKCKGEISLDLKEGPYSVSQCGKSMFSLAYGSKIENMRGGKGENFFGLNSLDNIVDAKESESSIFCWSENSGKDIVYGFKIGRDSITLESNRLKASSVQYYYDKELKATCLKVTGSQLCLVEVPFKHKKDLKVDIIDEENLPDEFNPYLYLRKKSEIEQTGKKAPRESKSELNQMERKDSLFPHLEEAEVYLKASYASFENALFLVLFYNLIDKTLSQITTRKRFLDLVSFATKVLLDIFRLLTTATPTHLFSSMLGKHIALHMPQLETRAEYIGLLCQMASEVAANYLDNNLDLEKTTTTLAISAASFLGGVAGHWAGMWALSRMDKPDLKPVSPKSPASKTVEIDPEMEGEDASGMHFTFRR